MSVVAVNREGLKGRIGTVLKQRYNVDGLLEVGGIAAVYSGSHKNGRRVSLKVLHPDLATNPDLCQRFLREGYVANAVEHTGAATILDDDTAEDGAPFLVLELLKGVSLEQRLAQKGPLPPEEALYVADQVLDVLVAAHEKGISHGDIKPANVFLTSAGPIKLLDFGVARMRREALGVAPVEDEGPFGTSSFSAPEQARGEAPVDWRADIWSVGALLFTALTARSVHPGDSSAERRAAAASESAPGIKEVWPGLPPSVIELVDVALAFEKEKRHQTARLMQRETRAAYQALVRGPVSSDAVSAKPSWAEPGKREPRPGDALMSATLLSAQPAPPDEDAVSIDVQFEEPVVVVETPLDFTKTELAVRSGPALGRPSDSVASTDRELVTPGMLVDSEQEKTTEPGAPAFAAVTPKKPSS